MDSAALVNGFDAEAGREAVEAFDRAHLKVNAALWLYLSESQVWRLVIAAPLYDSGGPKEAYTRVSEILTEASLSERLPLSRISIVSPQHPLISLFRGNLKVPGIGGVRFMRNVLNGTLIEDAYIYRMDPGA